MIKYYFCLSKFIHVYKRIDIGFPPDESICMYVCMYVCLKVSTEVLYYTHHVTRRCNRNISVMIFNITFIDNITLIGSTVFASILDDDCVNCGYDRVQLLISIWFRFSTWDLTSTVNSENEKIVFHHWWFLTYRDRHILDTIIYSTVF